MDQKQRQDVHDMQIFMSVQRLVDQSTISNNLTDVCSAEVIAASETWVEPDFVYH